MTRHQQTIRAPARQAFVAAPILTPFLQRTSLASPLSRCPVTRIITTTTTITTTTVISMTTTAPTPTPPPPPPTTSMTTTALDDAQRPTFKLPDPMPQPAPLTTLGHAMHYTPKPALRQFATSVRLIPQLRGRLAKGTVLTVRLSGALSERTSPSRPFSAPELTLPLLIDALRLAAYDPRIAHLHLRIEPLECGWGKLTELRRHIDFFASAGKTVSAFMEAGGPKEFFVAMGYALYVPNDATLSLRGFMASGSFLRGVLGKIGIDPQVERIGAYKSAGDQLARRDMSPEQREVLKALLTDINDLWTRSVCEVSGMDAATLAKFINDSPQDMQAYVEAGLITGTCYESELDDALKLRFVRPPPFSSPDEKAIMRQKLPAVDVFRYSRRTTPRLMGIEGRKRIALIRAVGVITPGRNSTSPVFGATLGSDTLVELLRKARDDKKVAGVILRIDSPGGAALSSDIVWNELRALRAVKPVVASQVDAAASGGYYLSMACEIVAEALSITGSVGVVTAKPTFGELYQKIGLGKENVSVGGRYAELLVDDRPFSEEENEYFKKGARLAYDSFVRKAAISRGKSVEDMDKVAQGRVWTGQQAQEQGLVDHIGGTWRAIDVLKQRCDIEDDFIKVEELKVHMSLAERLGLGGTGANASGSTAAVQMALQGPLAVADVDGSLGQVSPLSSLLMDVSVAPFLNMVSQVGGKQWINAVQTILKTISQ